MINFDQNNTQKYKKIIMHEIRDFVYRRKRYAINYSFAIGLADNDHDLKDFVFSKRQTDIVIVLEKNIYCVLFDSTPMKYAIHAISNLKVKFKKVHKNEPIYISVVNSADYFNEDDMLDSLFEILQYSINHDMEGLVTDMHEMGHSSTLNKNRI